MLIGYARVSTQEQELTLQLDALKAAGCERIYEERASGAQRDRPELKAALGYMREGDTLVVWKLDRLARSLKQLIDTVEDLGARGIGLRSVTEAIDTTTSSGKLIFHIFRRPGRVRARGDPRANLGWAGGSAQPWAEGWTTCGIVRQGYSGR